MNTISDDQIEIDAVAFAKSHRKAFAKKLTDTSIYISEENPVSVFMAGSPGAGKTEASLELMSHAELKGSMVLRIDPDDLRQQFALYNGKNSHLFQGATSILVERILDEAFDNSQSFLLDGDVTPKLSST